MSDDQVQIVQGAITSPTTLMLGRYRVVEYSPLESMAAKVCGIKPEDMKCKRAVGKVLDARYIVFHLLHEEFAWSKREIATRFSVDHTAITYALKKTADWLAVDRRFKAKFDAVKTQLGIQ